ncbi:Planctomycete PGAMP [Rhodopirellula bahusiensis]|uniref:Planctomycete PGAMP n=1 Tax=Rhodopirellula bahusiensis TaxID=2014065 RepID=A0A2G1W1N1_9BACT|nr:Planctomycete PGAMP [Rhodopirellula bahusiensis]
MWIDIGRWPTNFLSFSIPGAMPLASMVLAVGQQNRLQKRNFKTNPSGLDYPLRLQHGADVRREGRKRE